LQQLAEVVEASRDVRMVLHWLASTMSSARPISGSASTAPAPPN
jgi:hypothetical protein